MRVRTWLLSAILSLLLLHLLPSNALAQISGTITSDTTWTAGTVTVSGTVTVPDGVTLTIDPGVTVEFASGTSLIVAGKLVADGENGNSIVFTSGSGSPAPGDWNGIEFQNSANVGSMFDFCIVEYAGGGTNSAGIFYKTGAFAISITNSTFRYSSNHGVNTRASSPLISKSWFYENQGYGIFSDLLSNFTADSCTIVHNTTGGIRIPVNATPTVTGSIIDTNGIGIFIDNSAIPTIQNNNIRANSTGIQFVEVGAQQPTIQFNTLENNTLLAFENISTTTTVRAELNYWGHDSGPYHPALNPTGLGDEVSDRVDFQPWSNTAAAKPVKQITSHIAVNTTWYADTVYWVKTNITVNSGITLTLEPGTIVKFAPSVRLTVSGTIAANGTSDSLIVFTSERDDPYGGDTNGDGTTTQGAPGNWDMLFLNAGGNNSSDLNYCLVRFGGSSGFGNIRVHAAVPDLTNITSSQSSNYGIYFTGAADVTVMNSSFTGNNLDGILIQATVTQNYYGVKGIGNKRHGILGNSGTINLTIRKSVFMGNSGTGVVADAGGSNATVTSIDSSDISGNAGGGLYLWNGSGAQTISYNRIADNTAYGLWVYNAGSTVTIEADTITGNGQEGIVTSKAVIQNNIIQNNRYPIALLGNVGSTYSGNTITGNTFNNVMALRINQTAESFSDTLRVATLPGFAPGVYVLIENTPTLGVVSGSTFVIEPGVIIKINPNILFRVDGTLIADGTPENPIVFTSYRDASHGGKTNLESDLNPPAPGNWRYVRIRPGAGAAGSILDNCIFAYGGTDGVGNLWIEGANSSLTNQIDSIVSRRSSSMGIYVSNVQLIIANATIDSNATYGMYIDGSNPGADVTLLASGVRDNANVGLRAVHSATFRNVSNSVIERNNASGVVVDNGTVPTTYLGNMVTNNNGHGLHVTSPSVSASQVQFIGNTVSDNLFEGIFSTAATFIDNTITGNRYPIGVFGRLGNSYVDNNGQDGNIITGNTFNNAIALAGGSARPLRDTLKNVFPEAITSHSYVVIENVQVSSGETLVIEPGVNIKFDVPGSGIWRQFNVFGTLKAEGTVADPIIFTSWRDSTVGGKTIAVNDYSVPAPGDWYWFAIRSGSSNSVVRHCQFKYGGRNGEHSVWIQGGVTFSNNLVRKSFSSGIVVDNVAAVIDSTTVDSCNTFGIRVYDRVSSNVSVTNSKIVHNGAHGLLAEGTNGKFSSISDNTISNNLNSGIRVVNNTIPLSIVGNTISNNTHHGIYVLARNDAVDSLVVIAGNKVRNNGITGIFSSRAHVVDDSISGNRYAVGVVGQLSLDGSTTSAGNVYSGNVIEGNTYNDVLVTEETTFGWLGASFPPGYDDKVVAVRGGLQVPSGATLTIEPGTIVKFPKEYSGGAAGGIGRFRVDGILKSEGTLQNKIVFTSWNDDSYGGDSNADSNATVPGTGNWDMIYLVGANNNNSHLLHTIVRYGGSSGNGNIRLDNNSAPIDSSFVSFSSNFGIYSFNSSPSIYANEIHDNSTGIYITGSSNPVVQLNNIYDNGSYGLNNASSNTINAANNWWGDESGPFVNQGSDQNLSGTGDRIGINPGAVTYRPFLLTRSGILLGDVSENGTISAFDGALVLRHVVELDTLSLSQELAADVSGDGNVTSFDASLILRYVVGLITGFPGLGKTSGEGVLATAYEFSLEAGSAPDEVALVLRVNGTANIFASDMHFVFDPGQLTPLALEKTALSDEMSAQSRFGSRSVSVALAGTKAVSSEGTLVRILFKTKQQYADLSETSISFTKFLLNETQLLTAVEAERQIPTTFGLDQNYPNPFNPTTTIQFQLPSASSVTIMIYDMLGRQVRELVNGDREAGYYSITWDGMTGWGNPAASGVYFYRISAKSDRSDFAMVKRMLLVR